MFVTANLPEGNVWLPSQNSLEEALDPRHRVSACLDWKHREIRVRHSGNCGCGYVLNMLWESEWDNAARALEALNENNLSGRRDIVEPQQQGHSQPDTPTNTQTADTQTARYFASMDNSLKEETTIRMS